VHEKHTHHGILHEQRFFEFAGDLTVEVEFLLSDEQADMLPGVLGKENVRVFCSRAPAEFGTAGNGGQP
jgi:hypothetical protein